MKDDYKGFMIEWVDSYRDFDIKQHDNTVKQHIRTVEECKKWIDAKLKKKYKRVQVFYKTWRNSGQILHGEATSLADDNSAWVMSDKGERTKVELSSIWPDTTTTKGIFDQINTKEIEIKTLKAEIKELYDTAETLTAEMME